MGGGNLPTAIYQHEKNMQRVKLTRRVRMQRVNWVSWYADQEERRLTGCVRMQTKSKEGLTVYVRLQRVNCVCVRLQRVNWVCSDAKG